MIGVGSKVSRYITEHMNAWNYWALAEFYFSVAAIVYYIYLTINIIEIKDIESLQPSFWWGFVIVNSLHIAIILSKYLMLWLEIENISDFDLFKLHSRYGESNLDYEMWLDSFNVFILVGNYLMYAIIPFYA